ncbi:DUF4188 domain-containing protein [Salinibaculum salinum]|uniref:DUF4188 domain-containing protein n=1 Tax=Salinibaculum salinum TaxID=3131996 RepID=UPI0030ECB3C2
MSLVEHFERVVNRIRQLVAGSHAVDDRRGRVHADRDDVVVFLIGMRINAFWKLHRWLPVFLVAPRMVRELRREADSGLLGSWTFLSPPRGVGFVQYWDSFEDLRRYARDSDHIHLEAWAEYNENASDEAVGLWHETYRIADCETVYNHMPPRGLGAANGSKLVSATGRDESAAGRLDGTDDPHPTVTAADPESTA